jgi:murein DD-endopeptidase MepM/ murein hydrolase activator NlpD
MLKREISFIVIPHSTDKVITKKFSLLTLRILLAVFAFVVAGLAFIVYNSFRIHYQVAELHYLKARNQELETRVSKISEIEKALGRLDKEGLKIKRMLGIEKNPPPIDLTQLVFSYRPVPPGSDTLPGSDSTAANQFIPTVPPTVGFVVSKKFSADHPGIDLAAVLGSPAFATAAGMVKETGWDSIYGNYITIKHAEEYETFYGHLERVNKVKGDSVRTNDIVGFVGSTGRSSGPHLHFEVRHKGNRIDPSGLFVIK